MGEKGNGWTVVIPKELSPFTSATLRLKRKLGVVWTLSHVVLYGFGDPRLESAQSGA